MPHRRIPCRQLCYLLQLPTHVGRLAGQLKEIEKNIGITLPHDNKNSGQTLSQLIAEKANPVADVAY